MAQQENPQKSAPKVIQSSDDQSGSIDMSASGREQNLEAKDSVSVPLTRTATGPRTAVGKERSKHNALTHGILSSVALLKNEPRPEFDALLAGFRDYFQPRGIPEEVLVEQLAVLKWRYRRVLAAEVAKNKEPMFELDASLGFNMIKNEHVFDHPDGILRYEASIERSFDRTLSQLERLQRIRLGQPVLPKLEVQHSLS